MNQSIYILGIHDGHNCGAVLSEDGRIIASISEERLTRRKNEVGFPAGAIREVLRIAGISAAQINEVAYASNFMHEPGHLKDLTPWYMVGKSDQDRAAQETDQYRKLIFAQRHKERVAQAAELLDLPEKRIVFVEHHTAHLAAAYYTAPNYVQGRPMLGITCDGSGDGIGATVSICRDNMLERIAVTNRHASLGKIYSRVTMLMGMTPWEHEYKLMGLAPYADPERSRKAAEPLRALLKLRSDGLGFEQAGELSTNFSYMFLKGAFERVRFDIVAGATQLFTEEMLVALVKGSIARTGIHDLCLGGGVFMNVKANMLLAELPEVHSLYIMPSAADESLAIGACLQRHYALSGNKDHGPSVLKNLYLGGEYLLEEEVKAVDAMIPGTGIVVSRPEDVDLTAVDRLVDGHVVARCRGRMEWGARALGNRSILSRADDYRVVAKINDMIKMRDFWMPFAPSIREESARRYFDDPKDLKPYFMILTYRSKADTYPEIIAGIHPKDRTLRPQVVTKQANPDYHKLITAFEKRTGMGAVLNTSFNLHGFPIVYSPADAIDVFLRSGLDHLALGHLLLSKPGLPKRA